MKKVIIIGAGPAGLTAGYDLLSKSSDYEVTIVEESPVVGGLCARLENEENVLDAGGHMFISNNPAVKKFWCSILPAQGVPSKDDIIIDRYCKIHNGGPDPEESEDVILSREKVTRIYKDNKFYESPVKFNKDAVKNLGIATSIKSGFSKIGGNVMKHKELSLEDYCVNRFGKQLYSMFLEEYLEKIWGKEPSRINSEFGVVAEKSLIAPIISTEKKDNRDYDKLPAPYAARYYYPKYGAYQMWETVADRFIEMGGSIHKNCKVTGINTMNDKIRSVRCSADGDEFVVNCDYLISSMPLRDLILGMDNVDSRVSLIAENLSYRGMVSVLVELTDMKWKNDTEDYKSVNDMIPDSVIYVSNPNVKVSRIQVYNNFSPYMVRNPEHFYLGLNYYCNEGDYYWSMGNRDWRKTVVNDLLKLGIIDAETSVIGYNKTKYNKAFPAYYDGFDNFETVKTYLSGFENLYCIGRNGQHRFSSIDESMKTSFEAVKNILGMVKSKDNVWNINEKSDADEGKSYNSALLSEEVEYRGNYVPVQKKIDSDGNESREYVPPRRMRRPMMTPIKKGDPNKLLEPIVINDSVVIAARPEQSIPITASEEENAMGAETVAFEEVKPAEEFVSEVPEEAAVGYEETVNNEFAESAFTDNSYVTEETVEEPVVETPEYAASGMVEEPAFEVAQEVNDTITDTYAEPVDEPVAETVEEVYEAVEENVPETVVEAVEAIEEPAPEIVEEAVETIEETAPEIVEETVDTIEEPVAETMEEAAEVIEESASEIVEETADTIEEAVAETAEESVEAIEEPAEEIKEETVVEEPASETVEEVTEKVEESVETVEEPVAETVIEKSEPVKNGHASPIALASEFSKAEEPAEEETTDSFSLPGFVGGVFSRKTINANNSRSNERRQRGAKQSFTFGRADNFKNEVTDETERLITREQAKGGDTESERVSFQRIEKFDSDNIVDATNPHERVIQKDTSSDAPKTELKVAKRFKDTQNPEEVALERQNCPVIIEKNEDDELDKILKLPINKKDNSEMKESFAKAVSAKETAADSEETEIIETAEITEEAVAEAVTDEAVETAVEEIKADVTEKIAEEKTEEITDAVEEVQAEEAAFEDTPVEETIETTVEETVEEQPEVSEEIIEETPAEETQAEEVAFEDTPVEETTETAVEETVEESSVIAEEEITEESQSEEVAFEEPVAEEVIEEQPAEVIEENSAEEVAFEEPAAETFEESASETFEEPAAEAFEEPASETFEEPAAGTFEEPVAETFEEPAAEAFEVPAAEAFEEPAAEEIPEPVANPLEDAFAEALKDVEAEINEAPSKEDEDDADSLSGINEQAASRSIVKSWQNRYNGVGTAAKEENKNDRVINRGDISSDLYGERFAASLKGNKGAMDYMLDDLDGGKEYVMHTKYEGSQAKQEEVLEEKPETPSKDLSSYHIIKESGFGYNSTTSSEQNVEKNNNTFGNSVTEEHTDSISPSPVKPIVKGKPDYFNKEIDTSIVFKNARVIKSTKITRNPEEENQNKVERKETIFSDRQKVIAVIRNGEVIPVKDKSSDSAVTLSSERLIKSPELSETNETVMPEPVSTDITPEEQSALYDVQNTAETVEATSFAESIDTETAAESIIENTAEAVAEEKAEETVAVEEKPAKASKQKGRKKKEKKSKPKKSTAETTDEIMQPPISVMLDAKEAAEMTEPLENPVARNRNVKL